MPLTSGTRIGPYEVGAPLGAGGMGEVCRISNVWRVPLLADRPATWNDATAIASERAYLEFVDVSPDGTQLAVSSDRRGNQDLWLLPSAGGDMVPLPRGRPMGATSCSALAGHRARGS